MKKNQPVTSETAKQIKKLAKKVNDSLYRLEKKGLDKTSSVHKSIRKKSASDTSGIYSRSGAKPRVTGSAKEFKTEAEAQKYQKQLQKILEGKSRTVSGVRKAKEQRSEKIKATAAAKRERKAEEAAARREQGLPEKPYEPTDRLKKEMKAKVKKINDSLRRLEKAGVQDESREYQIIEHYALDKNSPYYNVNLDTGAIRVTGDFSRFDTPEELYKYNNVLNNILNSKTRTVTGTRDAMDKAYKTFLESAMHKDRPEMSYDQYTNIFKIYRTKVNPDRKDKAGSDIVVQMIRNTNLYEMDDDDIEAAMKYEFEDTNELQKVQYDEVKGTYIFIK